MEYTNPQTESAEFGYALTAHDGHPFVGDPSADYNARAPGAAYRYTAPGSTATVLKNMNTIYNPTPTLSEDPAASFAVLTTDVFVVGDGADDSGGQRSGCVTITDIGNPPSTITISEPPTGLGPQAEAMFGYCVVKVDSDHFLASAPGLNVNGVESVGEAYLFDTDGNLVQTFKNPFPEVGDRFGAAIRVSGSYALINCWPDVDDPNNSGAVCMFEIDTDPTGPDDAVYIESFMTFDNHFGNSIAALGDNLLVGMPDSDSGGVIDTGSVYLMSADTAWPMLTLTAASTGTPAADGDQFGFQVAAAGDNILVSAPGRAVDGTNAAGAVYLFDSDGDLLQVFENPSPEEGDGFGMSVAVVDDCVLIGAPYHDETGATDTGAAYLFPIDPTGSNRYPSPVATFLNPDDTDGAEDWFGWSVCGEGDDIVIGAPGDDDAFSQENVGAAYRFQWNASTRVWDDSSLAYPGFASPDDYFGWSVSMTDDRFLITARGEEDGTTNHAGKAFLFKRSDGTSVGNPLQAPNPQPEMGFGWSSVSVRDNRVLVTAATLQQSQQPGDLNGDGIVASDDLDIIREYWGQTVTPGDLLAGDASGDGFVGSDDLDIIRANWGDSRPPAIAGSAYLFDAEDGRLLRTFAEPTSAQYGFFGMSAAVVGDEVLVSAPNASLVISEEGAVYRFDMGIRTEPTDASGDYSFTGLEEGTYRVRQRPATGYWQTEPSSSSTHTLELDEGENVTGLDFGVALIDYDADDDGLLDAWEISYGFDPSDGDENSNGSLDGQDDADGDGVTNIEELDYGTNPNARDTDGDGTNDDVEISQGSDPNDAGDGGLAPPGDMVQQFRLEVGDGSMFARWRMDVGDVRCVQPNYIEHGYRNHFFDAGESYEISLEYLDTYPGFLQGLQDGTVTNYFPLGAVGPCYDWSASVTPITPPLPIAYWIDDPESTAPAIGPHAERQYTLLDANGWDVIGKPNLAEGKTATLHIPLLDADVDSKNDNDFKVPVDNEEEDRLEYNGTTGKYVIVNDEDIDGDGIIDYDDMQIDRGKFVPMNLTLSQNVDAAGLENPDDIMYTFVYPQEPADPSNPDAPVEPKYICLWKPDKDAPNQWTENDIIRPGVAISRTDLGLDPGGSVVIYIEGLAPSPDPISIQVYANVRGTNLVGAQGATQCIDEHGNAYGAVTLCDLVHVQVIDLDIDTDSDNDGDLDGAHTEDAVEDKEQLSGRLILWNVDDDNENNVVDLLDDHDDYPADRPRDDDFAMIALTCPVASSSLEDHELWLGAQPGLELYAECDKTPLDVSANGMWYKWVIGDTPAPPTCVYAEGRATGTHHVYWRLVKPGGSPDVDDDVLARDTIQISVVNVDIDVDSDNNSGNSLNGSDAEEVVENDDGHPGKYVLSRISLDSDNDGIPNYLDGFNWMGDEFVDDDQEASTADAAFTEIVLRAAPTEFFPRESARYKVSYSASNPAPLIPGLQATGNLRLWTENASIPRNPNDLAAEGDYVASDAVYTADQLKLDSSGESHLWMEGILPGESTVEFYVDPDGPSGSAEWILLSDTVKVTVILVDMTNPMDTNGDGIVNDFAYSTNGNTGNAFRFEGDALGAPDSIVCTLPFKASVTPNTQAVRDYLAGQLHVSLDAISNAGFTSELAWTNSAPGDSTVGNLIYNPLTSVWESTATFTGLPDVPEKSQGRVPEELRDLLYGARTAELLVRRFNSTVKEKYEVYFGDNLVIDGKKMALTVENYENYIEDLEKDSDGSASSLRREMYEKMNCAVGEGFAFTTLEKAKENYDMREKACELMNSTGDAGGFDLDYSGLYDGYYHWPRIGDTYSDGTSWHIGSLWIPNRMDDVKTRVFMSAGGNHYDSIMAVEPFRGECSGAAMIVVLRAAAETLGETRFNGVHAEDIYLLVGAVASSPAFSCHVLPRTDDETMVPGDSTYFKNKDNYSLLHDDGMWAGENCIYVGLNGSKEALFSGLGLLNKTEDELREIMRDHYNDDDPPLSEDDPEYIHEGDQAEEQIRFVSCERLRTGT